MAFNGRSLPAAWKRHPEGGERGVRGNGSQVPGHEE